MYIYIYNLSKLIQQQLYKDQGKFHNPALCVQVKFLMGSCLDIEIM